MNHLKTRNIAPLFALVLIACSATDSADDQPAADMASETVTEGQVQNQDQPVASGSSADGSCADVTWHGRELAEPGVLTVPVSVGGEIVPMQVDTGADYGGLSGTADDWPGLAFERDEGTQRDVLENGDFSVAGRDLNKTDLALYGGERNEGSAGTIGYENLKGGIWLLSQSSGELCHLDPNDPRMGQASFIDTPIVMNKQMLNISVDGEPLDGFFFDTGALFSTTSSEVWSGLVDPAAESTELEVPSWGNMITIIGKPIKGSLVIGDQTIDDAVIFQDADRSFFGNENTPEGMIGLIGMNAVAGRDIIFDLRDGQERFGVMP
ncbi:MAG: hypothetical protein WBG08_10770 [Litorimonas sp.]